MSYSAMYEVDKELLSFFNGGESLFVDGLAANLTCGYIWIPLYIALLLLVIKNNETVGQILLIVGAAFFCILLAGGMTDFLVKPMVSRLRPTADPLIKYTVDVVNNYRESGFSFFSAHAANTMSIAIFFSLLVRERMFFLFMLGWSLTNCWTRLYLGVHYPSDVLVGMIWGAVSGVISYFLYIKVYKRIAPRQHFVSSQYSKTGYSLKDIDITVCTLLFIYIFSIILSLV